MIPKINLLSIFLGLGLALPVAVFALERYVPVKKAEMVWVQENRGNYDLAYAYHDGQQWKGNLMLTTDNIVNFVPAIARNNNGETWLVWSSDTSQEYLLYYAVIAGNEIKIGPQQIVTSLKSNATPALIIDNQGTPWIAWSGNNGGDDEIYFSHFNGNGWAEEKRLHEDNTFPDIFPELSINDAAEVQVSWTNITPSGSTTKLQIIGGGKESLTKDGMHSLGQGVKNRKLKQMDHPQEKLKEEIGACIPDFPAGVKNLDLATLQLNCKQSTKVVQFVGKELKESIQGSDSSK